MVLAGCWGAIQFGKNRRVSPDDHKIRSHGLVLAFADNGVLDVTEEGRTLKASWASSQSASVGSTSISPSSASSGLIVIRFNGASCWMIYKMVGEELWTLSQKDVPPGTPQPQPLQPHLDAAFQKHINDIVVFARISLPSEAGARPRAPVFLGAVHSKTPQPFQRQFAAARIDHFWCTSADFGIETKPLKIYFDEIVSDRFILVRGMQHVHDELQLAGRAVAQDEHSKQVSECSADFHLPTVVSTLGHTNCGDRIHQTAAMKLYMTTVARRFATISETGLPKMENFAPTGGGSDHGKTLAHVTVAHHLDSDLRDMVYRGNPASFLLYCIDLMTHCGIEDDCDCGDVVTDATAPAKPPAKAPTLGMARESHWREPRTACGAVVGCLKSFDATNAVHQRLHADLGGENFAFLASEQADAELSGCNEGSPLLQGARFLVASALVAMRGMLKTLAAFAHDMDERGVATCTASITVNRAGAPTLLYLGRGTCFQGEVRHQGLGLDARRYRVAMDGKHLVLKYGDGEYPVQRDAAARPLAGSASHH
eukprot:gnl/Spiro4/3000_TR1476_c0_g1_i1.p1 gnl/Spiro4/3000_TR1476_c0_g1~~gnl/Spiro4/3000_TR1476_c0_g1_i1.p1  ORF type:complete len:540 (-),score=166.01 gnl/Spiro4/3000_TR1476_c0_g1_i1:80-1699(-)